jgi:CDP-diacylglycerol--glycerol-3-phosphate 3-phosphatidyltransferase
MPSVYDAKKGFQALLRPAVDRLRRSGVRPNHLTLAALAGSLAAGAAPFLAARDARWLFVYPAWLFVRMALNAMDGMLAREHGMVTPLGGALNEIGDATADLALYLPLAWFHPAAAPAVAAFSIAALMTEFCGLLGPALGASRRYEGPMGKSDRAFWVGLLCLLFPLLPSSARAWPWFFGAAATLAALTCFNRVRAALNEVNGKAAGGSGA